MEKAYTRTEFFHILRCYAPYFNFDVDKMETETIGIDKRMDIARKLQSLGYNNVGSIKHLIGGDFLYLPENLSANILDMYNDAQSKL